MLERKITEPEKIKERYLNGGSVTQIAKDYNVSREAIYLVLRKLPDWEQVIERTTPLRQKKALLRQYPSLDTKAIELRKKGVSATQVSKDLNVPYTAVRGILRGTRYDNSQKAKQKRNKKIFKGYKSGKTQAQLAKEFNTSQQNISNILNRNFSGKL